MQYAGKETLLSKLGLICRKCSQEKEVIVDKTQVIQIPVLMSDGKEVMKPRHPAFRHPDLCRFHRQKMEGSYGEIGKDS